VTLDDTEAAVQAACLALFELRGILAGRTDAATLPGQPRRVPEGWSDITAILPALADGRRGVFLGVECKRPPGPRCPAGGRVSPEQAAFAQRVRAAGGEYLVIDDVAELSWWLNHNLDPSYHRPADFDPPADFPRPLRSFAVAKKKSTPAVPDLAALRPEIEAELRRELTGGGQAGPGDARAIPPQVLGALLQYLPTVLSIVQRVLARQGKS
jgi:hypothetical protein